MENSNYSAEVDVVTDGLIDVSDAPVVEFEDIRIYDYVICEKYAKRMSKKRWGNSGNASELIS